MMRDCRSNELALQCPRRLLILNRRRSVVLSNGIAVLIEMVRRHLNGVKAVVLSAALVFNGSQVASAADYAREISAFRHANKLSSVTLDSQLNAFALAQAQAMSTGGKVSHEIGGSFAMRAARISKSRTRAKAAENIAAGFLTFSETLKQWEDSPGHRENLLMPGAHKVEWPMSPTPSRHTACSGRW
jgi:hypothetical protein